MFSGRGKSCLLATESQRIFLVTVEPIVRVDSPVVLRSVDMQVTLQCYVEASPKSLNTWQRGKSQASKYSGFEYLTNLAVNKYNI